MNTYELKPSAFSLRSCLCLLAMQEVIYSLLKYPAARHEVDIKSSNIILRIFFSRQSSSLGCVVYVPGES